MFANTAKSLAAAAVIAVSALASAPVANAQGISGQFQLQTVSGRQLHFGGPNFSVDIGPRGRYGRNWNGHRNRRNFCTPGEAVHKASRYGLRHAGVRRVLPRAIVVSGLHRGHRARMVFSRYSYNCQVIASRGI